MWKPVLLSAAMLALSPAGFAATESVSGAEAVVSTAAQEISRSARDDVADAVLGNLDVEAIARFTLGRHGRALSSAETARYTDAFERFLRRQIANNADQISGVELTVTKTLARNDHDAIVTTQVDRGADRMTLRWRLIERNGKWSVVDLEYAGIWLAIEQRAQVSAILDRPGATIDTVIAELN